jgi:hypothetical protein
MTSASGFTKIKATYLDNIMLSSIAKLNLDGGEVEIKYGKPINIVNITYKGKTISIDTHFQHCDIGIDLLKCEDNNMKLIQIKAVTGTLQAYYGYWLLGESNGSLITYISPDSMDNMGCQTIVNSGVPVSLRTEINDSHLYLRHLAVGNPMGGYKRTYQTDALLEVAWDAKAQWFSLNSVPIN